MSDHEINSAAFWEWVKTQDTLPFDEISRRFGDQFEQRIREYNWQMKKIVEAAEKATHLITHDKIGKLLQAYLCSTNPDFIEAVEEKKEEKQCQK